MQSVIAHVPPASKDAFDRISLAGKKILFDPKFHQNMELVKNPASRQDPVDTISTGILGLMWILISHAGLKLANMNAAQLMPYGCAASVLMLDVMDFANQSYGIPVDAQMIGDTQEKIFDKLYKLMHVSPEQLQSAVHKGAGEIQAHNQGKAQPAGGLLSQPGAQ